LATTLASEKLPKWLYSYSFIWIQQTPLYGQGRVSFALWCHVRLIFSKTWVEIDLCTPEMSIYMMMYRSKNVPSWNYMCHYDVCKFVHWYWPHVAFTQCWKVSMETWAVFTSFCRPLMGFMGMMPVKGLISWWINSLYHYVAADGRVDEWEVSRQWICEISLSLCLLHLTSAPSNLWCPLPQHHCRTTPPPKHSTDVDLTVDGPGVQFVGVPSMVDRPIHPSKVVEDDSARVGPSWTFVRAGLRPNPYSSA
jgi:hypothetical protein